MNNILLEIAYDGTHFLGWQKNSSGPSIEAALEKALDTLLKEKVALQAASRTDKGVHAKAQIVNFLTAQNIEPHIYKKALNALLPRSILVTDVKLMPPNFHPTLDNRGKEYLYTIRNHPYALPHMRLFSWHIPYPLDLVQMVNAAKELIGERDFSAFTSSPSKNNIRTIFKIDIQYDGYTQGTPKIGISAAPMPRGCARAEMPIFEVPSVYISISGNKFLYKMVRTIVGTLVEIGKGKKVSITDILAKKRRSLAGITAPAHGLRLEKIFF